MFQRRPPPAGDINSAATKALVQDRYVEMDNHGDMMRPIRIILNQLRSDGFRWVISNAFKDSPPLNQDQFDALVQVCSELSDKHVIDAQQLDIKLADMCANNASLQALFSSDHTPNLMSVIKPLVADVKALAFPLGMILRAAKHIGHSDSGRRFLPNTFRQEPNGLHVELVYSGPLNVSPSSENIQLFLNMLRDQMAPFQIKLTMVDGSSPPRINAVVPPVSEDLKEAMTTAINPPVHSSDDCPGAKPSIKVMPKEPDDLGEIEGKVERQLLFAKQSVFTTPFGVGVCELLPNVSCPNAEVHVYSDVTRLENPEHRGVQFSSVDPGARAMVVTEALHDIQSISEYIRAGNSLTDDQFQGFLLIISALTSMHLGDVFIDEKARVLALDVEGSDFSALSSYEFLQKQVTFPGIQRFLEDPDNRKSLIQSLTDVLKPLSDQALDHGAELAWLDSYPVRQYILQHRQALVTAFEGYINHERRRYNPDSMDVLLNDLSLNVNDEPLGVVGHTAFTSDTLSIDDSLSKNIWEQLYTMGVLDPNGQIKPHIDFSNLPIELGKIVVDASVKAHVQHVLLQAIVPKRMLSDVLVQLRYERVEMFLQLWKRFDDDMTKNGNELNPGHNVLQQLRRYMMDDVLKPYKLTADKVLDGVPPSKYTSTLYSVMGHPLSPDLTHALGTLVHWIEQNAVGIDPRRWCTKK